MPTMLAREAAEWEFFELLPGIFIEIDISDIPIITGRKWYLCNQATPPMLCTNLKIARGKYRRTSLQKFLLNPPSGMFAKFKNADQPRNFRRSNLIVMSYQDQSRRTGKRTTPTSSRFKGVSFRAARQLWAAMIFNGEKHILLGYFETEIEAAKRYNQAAQDFFGAECYLNEIDKNSYLTIKN